MTLLLAMFWNRVLRQLGNYLLMSLLCNTHHPITAFFIFKLTWILRHRWTKPWFLFLSQDPPSQARPTPFELLCTPPCCPSFWYPTEYLSPSLEWPDFYWHPDSEEYGRWILPGESISTVRFWQLERPAPGSAYDFECLQQFSGKCKNLLIQLSMEMSCKRLRWILTVLRWICPLVIVVYMNVWPKGPSSINFASFSRLQ